MRNVIMKKSFDYGQARKRIEFATAVIALVLTMVKLWNAVQPLLSVAFNYPEHSCDAKLS